MLCHLTHGIFGKRAELAGDTYKCGRVGVANDVEETNLIAAGECPFLHIGFLTRKRLLALVDVFPAFHEQAVTINCIESLVSFFVT